jgi:hypothetical protein
VLEAGIQKQTLLSNDAQIQILIRYGLHLHFAIREVQPEAQVLLKEMAAIEYVVELLDILEIQLDVFGRWTGGI